jgi:hypothetical protein
VGRPVEEPVGVGQPLGVGQPVGNSRLTKAVGVPVGVTETEGVPVGVGQSPKGKP